MSRDWQKDIDTCLFAKEHGFDDGLAHELPDIGLFWLQQYAAEKERAERLQEALEKAKYYLMREAYLPAEDVIDEALSSLCSIPERNEEA